MPQPDLQQLHVNRPLVDFSVMYRQEQTSFLGPIMAPAKPVPNKSDQYTVYTRSDFFRSQVTVRSPSSETAGGGWNVTNPTFTCLPYGLHKDIDDMDRANADAQYDMDRDATIWLTDQFLMKWDQVWAAAAFTTNVWTGSTTGSDLVGGTAFTKFSTAGSTPIEVIRAQVFNLALAGINPKNLKLAMGPGVWQILADHPELVARLPVTALRQPREQTLAELLGIGEVCIGWGAYNTAAEGATAAYSFLLGNNMLLAHVPPPGLITPAGSVTFMWDGYLGGNSALGPIGGTISIRKFRQEQIRSDRLEAEMAFVPAITAADLGVFFSACV